MAILVGLTLANSIRPGRGLVMPEGVEPLTPEDLQTPTSMADILQRLVPDNPVGAAAGGDILGLIFFSIVLGAAIGVMTGKTGDLLRQGFSAGFEAMMKVTTWVIRLLPIGVFALLARAVSQMGLEVFQQVGKYVLTIAVGLTLGRCRRDSVGRSGHDLHRPRGDRSDDAGGLCTRRSDAERRPPARHVPDNGQHHLRLRRRGGDRQIRR